MTPRLDASVPNGRRPGSFARILDGLSSIWFAITLLALIFIYSSIGSAIPPIRQGVLADWTGLELLRFDKTEMEWFSWWPFSLMIGLFCFSLLLATIRRIPANLAEIGVWFIHGGVIVLLVSSAVYFGTKVEGDSVIFGSRALIMAPGMTKPASLVVRPEAAIQVGSPGRKAYQIQIAQIMPDYEIRTGAEQGEKDQAIWFRVTGSDGQSFTRIVLAHHPEFTEDVVAGAGGMERAVKKTGKPLIDSGLQIKLDYDPARYFYHAHRMPVRSMGAIYARFAPSDEWTQFRFEHLPSYYDFLTHRNELWPVAGSAFPPVRALDLRGEVAPDANELGKLDVRITDFLAYAQFQSRFVEGGEALNPVVRIQYLTPSSRDVQELVAMSLDHRKVQLDKSLQAELIWVGSAEEREKWATRPNPRLKLHIESKKIDREVPMKDLLGRSQPLPVEGTDYALQVREVFPEGMMGESTPAMALVGITRKDKSFDRVILAGDASGGRDLNADMQPATQPSDPDLRIEYLDPAAARVLLIGGPGDATTLEMVLTGRDGAYQRQTAKVGAPITLQGQGVLSVEAVLPRARSEVRPIIVPRDQRESLQNVGKAMSMVRVEVNDGRSIESTWLPFNEYAFPDEQRAQPGRFGYRPGLVTLADGRQLQLLYSRPRDPLPGPVALDRFIRKTYPGGDRESDYISLLRFPAEWQDADGVDASGVDWSPNLVEVRSNHPARHGDLWYFQAQWDPGTQAHTVLGVGNRRAVDAMLAGVLLSIFGMAHAFYARPGLRRKRREEQMGRELTEDETDEAVEPEVTGA